MVTNHDVSTLGGWWHATDLRIRGEIGLLDPGQETSDLMRQRQLDKAGLLSWLESKNLPRVEEAGDNMPFDCEQAFTLELCGAILKACARSQSRMMSFQLDDLQLVQEPVNIPGTYREYPNWRRKQPTETATIFAGAEIQSLLSAIYRERKQ